LHARPPAASTRLRRAVVVSPIPDRNAEALPAYAPAEPAGPIVLSLIARSDSPASPASRLAAWLFGRLASGSIRFPIG
jgi:hypothetical protein